MRGMAGLGFRRCSMLVHADDVSLLKQMGPELAGSRHERMRDGFQLIGGGPLEAVSLGSLDMGANQPQLRLPAALGIALGRLLNLGAYPVFYLGRLFNFAYFAALAYSAMRFMPFGRRILMAVCYLPMTLHVTASYSYDAGILGLSFLLTALCLKAVFGTGPMDRRLLISIACVAFFLAPCKVIYSLIACLALLIPSARFSSKRGAILFKAGIFFIMAISIGCTRLGSLFDMVGSTGDKDSEEIFVRGTEMGVLYTLADALSDPWAFARLMVNTLGVYGDSYVVTAVGGSLGWFQPSIAAPTSFVLAFYVLVLLALPPVRGESISLLLWQRLFFVLLAMTVWLLVMISMYLAHTFNTESCIQGVQGRYILPMLPLALLAFGGRSFVARRDLFKPLVLSFSVMNAIYVTRIYALALLV